MTLKNRVDRARDAWGLWPARAVVFLFIYGVFLIPVFMYLSPQLELHHKGLSAQAVVLAKHPENHMSVRYEYTVEGKSYDAEWGPWPLDRVNIGDSIPITYLPRRPSVSVAGEPITAGWWVLPFVLLPLAAGVVAWRTVRSDA